MRRELSINNVIILLSLMSVFMVFNGLADTPPQIKEIRLNERVLILEHGPWNENMVVLDAGPSLVVIDTLASPPAAERAKAILTGRFHKRVSHVINTHHHWDHTFGNQVFAGAVIVGHRTCAEDMRSEYSTAESRQRIFQNSLAQSDNDQLKAYLRQMAQETARDFRLTPPDHLVGDRETLRVGELTLRIYHAPGLHTRSNLTIYVPELGLLFTRRDFHQQTLPALENGVDLTKLFGCLEDVLASGQSVKYLVVGHGEPLPDPDLTVPLAYLRALGQAVQATQKNGGSLRDAENDERFKTFPLIMKFGPQHQTNLRIVWQGANSINK